MGFTWRMGFTTFAKGIDSGQPAQFAQADLSRYLSLLVAGLHSLVGSVQGLRTKGCWFDPSLGQYSVRGLMIVIAKGFIPLSPLTTVPVV